MTAINSIQNLDQAKAFIKSMNINEFRCLHCGKLLAKINTKGILACEIKCPRCGKINEV